MPSAGDTAKAIIGDVQQIHAVVEASPAVADLRQRLADAETLLGKVWDAIKLLHPKAHDPNA